MVCDSADDVGAACARLQAAGAPVSARIRAVFLLRGAGGARAVAALAAAMRADPSVLVKHEAAYCLGQMRDAAARPHLERALRDAREDVIVRHEAAEALGALADPRALPVLDDFADAARHPREVFETCVLAAARIRLRLAAVGVDGGADADCGAAPPPGHPAGDPAPDAPYTSVDPAPPADAADARSVDDLCAALCDPDADLFARYRAMFALRNAGGEESVLALCRGLEAEKVSALFRHEVAFVLGQMQHPASIPALSTALRDTAEHEMVRHEAAEALGSIASPDAQKVLHAFKNDPSDVVRESVAVALDIAEYVADDTALHYAETAGGAEPVQAS